jgi:thiol:disulfide interchange protein DsbD
MLDRIVPARWSLLLFAVPAVAAAIVLWGFVPARRSGAAAGVRPSLWIARGVSILVAIYAAALLIGASRGSDDLLKPLAAHSASVDEPAFISVSSVADLQREVNSASAAHQAVMLDFYADWCTSCKEMQRFTFTDPQVRDAMKSVRLLRADVTANNADDQALLHKFDIFGPPTIAIYDAHGQEHKEFRVVGYMKAAEFAALLHQALPSG